MNKTLSLVLSLTLLALIYSSCSSTRGVSVPLQLPPQVMLPDHIQNVGIANRSLAGEEDGKKFLNVMEGVLTGEGLWEDKDGSNACLAGAASQLQIDNLVSVSVLDSIQLVGTGTGVMPIPLKWEQVDEICEKYNLDGLLVLEMFDTDQGNTATTTAIRQIVKTVETGDISPVAANNNSRVRVKMGWRFYDHKDHHLIDEIRMDDYFGVNGNTSSGIYDLGEFAKRDAIQQSAYVGGRAYAARMLPGWTRIWRQYYIRPKADMKAADRMVQVNDWNNAIAIWKELSANQKRKIAGRACYNLAIYYEFMHDYDQAIELAQKAYTQYKEKRARDYVRVLRNRR